MLLTAPEGRPIGVERCKTRCHKKDVRHDVIKMRTHKWTGTYMLIAFDWIGDIWLLLYYKMVSTNTSEYVCVCVCVCEREREREIYDCESVLKYILWV